MERKSYDYAYHIGIIFMEILLFSPEMPEKICSASGYAL
jgi:hypothetical protein